MKKILVCQFIAMVLLVACGSAYAENKNFKGKVSRILPLKGGVIKFKVDQTSGCAPLHTNHYFVIQEDAEGEDGHDAFYALLLASAYGNKDINVNADDGICSASTTNTPINYIIQDF